MNRAEQAQKVAHTALLAGMEAAGNGEFSIVVIVRGGREAGAPIIVDSNVISGAADVRAVIDQGRYAVPGGIIV